MFKKIFILLTMGVLTACGAGSSSNNNNIKPDIVPEPYLAKPTGQYGVGFKDLHFQDNNRCPDLLYSQVKDSDFSPDNTKHCREIMVRVYYPTNESIAISSPYYQPQIMNTKDYFNMLVSHIDPSLVLDFSKLNSLKSYAHESAPIVNSAFPVILYSPGSGSSVQSYENTITNLASHGYVVVGINSIFLSGYTQLTTNGYIITDSANDDENFTSRTSDIGYIFEHLHDINQSLSGIMNENIVGMMGQSDGANGTAKIISTNKYPFKAAIATDTDVKPYFESFTTPFLHILSGSRYWTGKYGKPRISYIPRYKLNKDNYLVGIVPTENELINPHQYGPLYSTHASFSNDATLQYMPVYKSMLPVFEKLYKALFGNSPGNAFGSGNGYEINDSINTNVLQFFDTYLKNKPNPVFNNNACVPLSPNTIISCGKESITVFPN